MRTKLYALSFRGEIRYIGKTIRPLEARLSQHVRYARAANKRTHKDNWILSLPAPPEIELLDEVEGDGCGEEIAMIGIARALGARITNGTTGGEGTTGMSAESRARIGAGQRGRVRSTEEREKIRRAKSGKALSQEARRKMSEARRGVKKSPEHAKKVSENSTRTKRQRRFFRVLFNSIVSRHVICEKSAP